MNTVVLIGLLVCLLTMLIGQVLNEKAWRRLSAEEKVKVFDGFSNVRLWGSIGGLLVLIIFIPLLYYYLDKKVIWAGALALIAILRLIFLHFYTQRRHSELATPMPFIDATRTAEIIKAVGWAVFIGTLIAWIVSHY